VASELSASSPPQDLLRQRLALVASLALVVVVVFRTLAVSGYQMDVALLMLGRADRPALLASTLLQAVAIVGALLLVSNPQIFRWLQEDVRDGSNRWHGSYRRHGQR
jgi:hypothetical protein